jgi:hypothetical protein
LKNNLKLSTAPTRSLNAFKKNLDVRKKTLAEKTKAIELMQKSLD